MLSEDRTGAKVFYMLFLKDIKWDGNKAHVSIFSLKSRARSPDRCFIIVLPVLLPSFQESCVKRVVDAG